MSKEAKILIAIAVVVVIGGVLLAIFANPRPKDPGAPVDSQSLVRDTSHMTGKSGAKVTVVEFGDFQCPACGAAYPAVKKITDEYKNNPDFNFVFRNFPLETIHPNAHIGAEAAEAAGTQGKYWEMHDTLYEHQNDWVDQADPTNMFVAYAQAIGVGNIDQFKNEIAQRQYADIIATDEKDGEAVGVNSTPTFFINGVKEAGVMSYDEMKSKIDAELAK
jgi:protein-disulfide isomerase